MFYFASKGGYYLSAAFIQERPLIEHIRFSVDCINASGVHCAVRYTVVCVCVCVYVEC